MCRTEYLYLFDKMKSRSVTGSTRSGHTRAKARKRKQPREKEETSTSTSVPEEKLSMLCVQRQPVSRREKEKTYKTQPNAG